MKVKEQIICRSKKCHSFMITEICGYIGKYYITISIYTEPNITWFYWLHLTRKK